MFCKIALNNVKKSMKDYMIYFMTLTFGVCLFYVFNSLESQQAMLAISKTVSKLMVALETIINVISIFISVILGFLIIYANRFLMKRRKKELGIYMTLGMEKSKISQILTVETFFIGIFSLVAGLFLGAFASQGAAVLAAKVFVVKMKEFHFVFSTDACLKTVLYFGIIFLIVIIFNSVSLKRLKLIDLIMASKKNETLKVKKLWVSVLLFILSVVCLGVAYYMIMKNGMLTLNFKFKSSIVLGILGTFLFFLSLSGFLLRVVKSCKPIYLRGLNMFVLRQINSKITTAFVSMSLICLMLLVAIGVLSSGAGLAATLSETIGNTTPYSASMWFGGEDGKSVEKYKNGFLANLKAKGVKVDDIVKTSEILHVYTSDITNGDLMKYMTANEMMPENTLEKVKKEKFGLIPVSEYNKALKLQGKEIIQLKENEVAISCSYNEIKPAYNQYIDSGDQVVIEGKNYQCSKQLLEYIYFTAPMGMDTGTLIVPDTVVKGMRLSMVYENMQYFEGVDKDQTQDTLSERCDKYVKNGKDTPMLITKNLVYEQSKGMTMICAYVAVYIGIIFLITCSAILALQQLSENSDNQERYRLLRKLGTEEKEMNKSIFLQILITFLMPLSLALVHAVVGVHVANEVIKYFGHLDVTKGILSVAFSILAVYGGYMIATYYGCRAMIKKNNM